MRPSTIAKPRTDWAEGPQPVPSRPSREANPLWKRKLAVWSRWLHIYLSMVSFAIVLFFAVTGLTLNHQQWFTKQQKTLQYKATMNTNWLRGGVARLEVVEYLRTQHKISSAVSEFRMDASQASVSFKGPGYAAAI